MGKARCNKDLTVTKLLYHNMILIMKFLVLLSLFLSFLAIFRQHFLQCFNLFLEFLNYSRLTCSSIVVKFDWQSQLLTKQKTGQGTMGGCLMDGAVGK